MGVRTKSILAAVFATALWSMTNVSAKILLQYFTPLQILVVRFFLGCMCLQIICPRSKRTIKLQEEFKFALAGLLGTYLYFVIDHIAVKYTTVTNIAVFSKATLITTALLAYVFLKERNMKRSFWIGRCVSVLGLVLYALNGNKFQIHALGDSLIMINNIIWGAYSCVMKKIQGENDSNMEITKRVNTYGFVFILITYLLVDRNMNWMELCNIHIWPHFLYLGIGASCFCFVMWNYAIKHLGVAKCSICSCYDFFLTMAVSIFVLHESITIVQAVAGLLIVLGVMYSVEGSRMHIFINEKEKKI